MAYRFTTWKTRSVGPCSRWCAVSFVVLVTFGIVEWLVLFETTPLAKESPSWRVFTWMYQRDSQDTKKTIGRPQRNPLFETKNRRRNQYPPPLPAVCCWLPCMTKKTHAMNEEPNLFFVVCFSLRDKLTHLWTMDVYLSWLLQIHYERYNSRMSVHFERTFGARETCILPFDKFGCCRKEIRHPLEGK